MILDEKLTVGDVIVLDRLPITGWTCVSRLDLHTCPDFGPRLERSACPRESLRPDPARVAVTPCRRVSASSSNHLKSSDDLNDIQTMKISAKN